MIIYHNDSYQLIHEKQRSLVKINRHDDDLFLSSFQLEENSPLSAQGSDNRLSLGYDADGDSTVVTPLVSKDILLEPV